MKTTEVSKDGNQMLERATNTTTFSKVFGNTREESAVVTVDDSIQAEELPPILNADEMQDILSKLDPALLEEILAQLIAENDLSSEAQFTLEDMLASLSLDEVSTFDLASEEILAAILQEFGEMQLLEQENDLVNNLMQHQAGFQAIIHLQANSQTGKVTDEQAQAQLKELYSKVESLLQQVHSHSDLKRVAPKLLVFLQEWQQLLAKANAQPGNQLQLNTDNKQLENVWQDLVQAYEKRMGMNRRNHYNLDAKVSTHEIVRWLGNAMEVNVQADKIAQPAITNVNMPISKVEQFMIHVNQTQAQPSADKQLIEQFQKIMDASKISSLQNNRGQLSITLKPVNLGEMIVRFTQVNGEMVVKILVTTDVAKRMLDGNMQQLRGMFSPQQVVVEKQELNITQSQEAQNDEASTEHEDRNEEQQTNPNNKQEQEDDSFATIFEDLVLNEKV